MQLADGGVALHWMLQLLEQLAWQEAVHSSVFALDEQLPLHDASQSVSHEPWQSKLPGLPEHIPEQLASQPPVQFTSAIAVQPPLHITSSCAAHDAWTVTGVHCAVQPPEVSTTQVSLAVTSRLSQALSTSARAVEAAKSVTAEKAAARAVAKTEVRRMKSSGWPSPRRRGKAASFMVPEVAPLGKRRS
jgi:hypothetical protein